MKVACLQFNQSIGEVEKNQNFASKLLEEYQPGDIDILVLPELAFTGYVFKDKDHIKPYLEDSETGTSVQWAKAQAVRLHAFVVVGYPQIVKDESWAEEGPGFKSINVPNLGKIGFGICMDINPYQFKASFRKYEFANYHIQQQTEILLCSMAWLQSSDDDDGDDKPSQSTINYWCNRLLPYFTDSEAYYTVFPTGSQNSGLKRNVLFVACNRTGTENGSCFAGSSSVLLLSSKCPIVLGSLKSKQEAVMVIDVPPL